MTISERMKKYAELNVALTNKIYKPEEVFVFYNEAPFMYADLQATMNALEVAKRQLEYVRNSFQPGATIYPHDMVSRTESAIQSIKEILGEK